MKTVSMSGSLRENVGKTDAKQVRKSGLVPGVLYGGTDQLFVHVDEKALLKVVYSPDAFQVNLTVNGKEYKTILQHIQIHPVTDKIIHVDFLEASDSKPLSISLPIVLSGSAKGVLKGGILVKPMRKLKVKGIISKLPDVIEIDITKLGIGKSIKVKDLVLPGIEILENAHSVICKVKTARGIKLSDVADDDDEEEVASEESAVE